jgi:signal transduction histidine kinase
VEEPDNISQDYVSSEFRRNIYLTVKESLHNIVKHAQATEVFINIEISNWLTIQIRDNGMGINNSPKNSWGNGLVSMNNRVKELKGAFKIENMEGTLITIKVPLNH